MPLTTDADVIAYCQATGRCLPAALRSMARQLRATAENLVKDFVGYEIEQAEYQELHPDKLLSTRFDGDNTAQGFDLMGGSVVARETFPLQRRELVLMQLPIRSIEAVYDNPAAYNTAGGAWPSTSLLPANTYILDVDTIGGLCWSGILRRNIGSWGVTPRTVRVDYTAGLTAAELASRYTEFAMAVKITCAKIFADALARANMARTGQGPTASVGIQDFSWAQAPGNQAMIGGFLGAGISSAALPTEAAQWLMKRRHPKDLF